MTDSCNRPVLLPEGNLTQSEVEAYWIKDREQLIRCGFKFEQLVEFYTDRDARITNE